MFMHNIKGSRVEVFDGGGVRHRRAVPHPHPQDEPALIRRDAVADHRLLWSSEGGLLLVYASVVFISLLALVIAVVFLLKKRRAFEATKEDLKREPCALPTKNAFGLPNSTRCGSSYHYDRTAAFVNLGSLPHSITKMKIPSYSCPSSSSSDNECSLPTQFRPAVPLAPGAAFGSFLVGPVQPILEHAPSHTPSLSQSSADEPTPRTEEEALPKVTFSISLEASPQSTPAAQTVSQSDLRMSFTLIKASNLERSSLSATPRIASAFRSSRPGGQFVAEGLFARIYKGVDLQKGCLRRQSSIDDPAREASGSDNEFRQTSVIKSRKSTSIKFPEEPVSLKRSDFPLRLTLYDVDKHQVRYSLGHCFVDLTDADSFSLATQVILTRRLFPTLYRAKNSVGK